MLERRKYQRVKSKLLITTVYRDDKDKIVTQDSIFSEDISAGGLRILFPSRLAKDKILDLKVFLFADPIHLPAQGKVTWSDKKKELELAAAENKDKRQDQLFWAGIEFINIDSFTRERILRWIRKEFAVRGIYAGD